MEMMLISVCLAIFLAFLFLKPLFTKTTTTKLNLPPSPWRRSETSTSSASTRTALSIPLAFAMGHSCSFTLPAFSPYGEYWRQMKSICVMNLLTNKTIRSFEDIRAEEINVLMGKLEKASSSYSPVNLSKLFINLSNDFITRVVLGKKYSTEGGEYISQNVVRKFMELVGTFPLGDFIPKLAWVEKIPGLDKKVEEVYKEFLLSCFFLEDMLFGAATTTFALLEWTMTELMRHPECMKKLKDEIHFVSTHNLYVTEQEAEKMSYLNLVIKEALRLHPGVPIAPRQLSEDVKVHGYDIAAGTQVLINIWAIQRDVSAWGQDAEELRPGRHLDTVVDFQGQNLKFIPFGSGRRQCPGSGYVVALVEVTLANLV
ncbi:unnamed protein product [Brassica oleracea var. botrytis]|uniref:(rape) hypothetical protein n=1 Tax=Brassica napus TaxID=3708 RepID=A0A078JVX5_BRANA|nr:unnamed protein product [Brassica napus]CDY70615.1 BnaCnng69050D [Brassica napus]